MRPLDGVRVIDASTYIVGPFAALQLADLGAEVVKVEPPTGGDPFRRFGRRHEGTSLMFANCNRNKRSVFLDLKSRAGANALTELLASADVFLTNWRPSVAKRLGFSAEDVRSQFPRLVWVRLTGFGQGGPLVDLPTFDSVVQARSGYASRTDGAPQLGHGYLVDKITAVFAAESALAALLGRDRTGEGAIVDLSMLDAMAYFNSPDLFAGHTVVDEPDLEVLRHLEAVRPVRTRDGWMVISPVSGAQLAATVRAVGHPEWVEQLRSSGTLPT